VNFDAALRVVLWMSDVLKPNRLFGAFDAANWKITVGYAERTVVNLTNFELRHGLASGEFLSNEELDSLHIFVDLALGWSAGSKVAASEAVHVLGLCL